MIHFSALVGGRVRTQGSSKLSSGVRFGQFELDLSEERLLRKGLQIRIENQPVQILAVLVDRPGEVVSREELCASLWPDGTYVDFDEGLNTAIKKLRYALGDSVESPIFIETIPRRGYRFIAPVQFDPDQPDEDSSEQLEMLPPRNGNGGPFPEEAAGGRPIPIASDSKPRWTSIWGMGFGIIFLGICGLLYRAIFTRQLHVTRLNRLSTSERVDPWGRLASDGSRLFFLERDGDHWNDRQVSVAGGESMPFGATGRNIRIHAVSPDQSEILFSPFTARLPDLPLWSMPLIGGSPRRVGEILANGAAYSPDGSNIAFTTSTGVFVANRDGSNVRQVAAVLECWDIAWSPDGKILRFHARGPRLWQVTPTGQDLHPFLPSWTAWEGRWTFDGSYYIFTAMKDGHADLWALAESPSFPWLQPAPVQLTFPPLSVGGALPSRDGHTIYAAGGLREQIDVIDYDPNTHQFKPVMPGFGVKEIAYSPDRQWVLYNDWNQLWRSRPDGSDRLRLAGAPSYASIHFARWSPDSKHVLFENVNGEKGTIYLVSIEEGTSQEPLPPGPSRQHPDWSPDGKTMVFSVQEESVNPSPSQTGLYLFDFAARRTTRIPGSEGLAFPRWSPDGRFLEAASEGSSVVKVLDFRTHRWTEVARGPVIGFPEWSPESVLYFQELLEPGEPVYRFHPGSSGPERVFSFEDVLQGSSAIRCGFQGFAPDGSVLVQVSRGGGDVYALTVR